MRSTEILKQGQFVPMPLDKQVIILYAVTNGFVDDVEVARLADFEAGLHKFMDSNHPEIGKSIIDNKDITPENEEALKKAITEFKQTGAF
jgi:F-type H+-transporting ATPase subunit alpha